MSVKRFTKLALRVTEKFLLKLGRHSILLRFGSPAVSFKTHAAFKPFSLIRIKNAINQTFRAAVRDPYFRTFIRSFATSDHNKIRFRGAKSSKYPHNLAVKYYRTSIFDKIKILFASHERYNKSLQVAELPAQLNEYKIGKNIACGCNAAVYELGLKDRIAEAPRSSRIQLDCKECVNISELDAFPFALKIMFNYEFDAPEYYLWWDMRAELVPLIDSRQLLRNHSINLRAIPHAHGNIVKMYKAFTDRMPVLDDARHLYPEALPDKNFYGFQIQEPRTLFIVMKRYRMTLREYVLTHRRNYRTGRVLFAQLLEAIVFLYDNQISHRDMKSDNILLDFNNEEEIPHLVLSDFGCALADGSFSVPYRNDDTFLGGNLALRAPEVRRALPSSDCYVDFRFADMWSAGTIGYEIFTRYNPFYKDLKGHTYMEFELPELPQKIHSAIRTIIREILRTDPRERPKPHVAATVLSLSLFRSFADIKQYLVNCGFDEIMSHMNFECAEQGSSTIFHQVHQKTIEILNSFILLYTSESILSRHTQTGVVSDAELQLRATFLSRLDYEDVRSAIRYFFVDESVLEL